MLKEYAFFPGCAIAARYPLYEKTVTTLLKHFGYDLKYPNGLTCCPEPAFMPIMNEAAWFTIGARNLSLAEEMNLDVLAACPGCTLTFSRMNERLRDDTLLKNQVNTHLSIIDKQYSGTTSVRSLLRLLYEEIGLQRIERAVKRPLQPIRAAIHYGCHSYEEMVKFDDPNDPQCLKSLASVLGVEVVSYPSESVCCLSFANPIDRGSVLDSLHEKFTDITNAGADCLIVMCPTCHLQLEMGQIVLEVDEERYGEYTPLPVYFYPELLAYSMEMDPIEIGLHLHENDALSLLQTLEKQEVL
jgi:heterodisulfide reductase subunit B